MLTDLLRQPPSSVLENLNKNQIQNEEEAERTNLLGLAFVAADKAREDKDIEWALVALRAYQILARVDHAHSVRDYIASSMLLRAYLIRHLGHVEGDEVLDANNVLHWFSQTVDMDLDNAKELVQEVQHARDRGELVKVKDTLLQLRRLKSKIYVLQQLYTSRDLQPPEGIQPWVELLALLP